MSGNDWESWQKLVLWRLDELKSDTEELKAQLAEQRSDLVRLRLKVASISAALSMAITVGMHFLLK